MEYQALASREERSKGRCRRLGLVGTGLAVTALLVAVAAALGSRYGLWPFRTGFLLLQIAAWGALAAALLGAAGVVGAMRRPGRRPGLALVALILGLIVAGVPLSWRLTARQVPRIHDLSTDTVNPPAFVALLPLRQGASNSADYGGPEIARQQHAAYPDLKTVALRLPRDEAFARALAAAQAAGWQIVAADAAAGRIEASDTTFWFGFIDDIVIRVTAAGDQSLLDIRSLSRVGISDVGTNARRIRAWLARINQPQ